LMPEEWGGQTVTVEVSARQKTNIDLLLEMILLSSDILELKANPKRSATGTVLEAKLDKGRGQVATVLVQEGTLSVGDTFIAGPIVGRVRALIDDRGRPTRSAGPSTPVEVLGLGGLPQPGDVFQVPDARVAAGADRRRRHEGAADHHQVRRPGLGRGAGGHADEAVG
jgi:translation initiation factor IF-2